MRTLQTARSPDASVVTPERYQHHFVHPGLQTPQLGAVAYSMSSQDDSSFQNRLKRASDAKSAMLTKFKQAMHPDNPAAAEKRRQRETIAAARAERTAQREAARQEHEREVARQAALAAEIAAERARADAEQAAREEAERLEREAALKAEEKAARDIRYAARKAAKKERRRGY